MNSKLVVDLDASTDNILEFSNLINIIHPSKLNSVDIIKYNLCKNEYNENNYAFLNKIINDKNKCRHLCLWMDSVRLVRCLDLDGLITITYTPENYKVSIAEFKAQNTVDKTLTDQSQNIPAKAIIDNLPNQKYTDQIKKKSVVNLLNNRFSKAYIRSFSEFDDKFSL